MAALRIEFGEDDEKTFFISDLDSANGTFVNGERLEAGQRVEVSDMDSIRLGPVVKRLGVC